MVSPASSLPFHCLWFFVNSANAFAPIATAFATALKTPPLALTCAPTNLLIRILYLENYAVFCISKLHRMRIHFINYVYGFIFDMLFKSVVGFCQIFSAVNGMGEKHVLHCVIRIGRV